MKSILILFLFLSPPVYAFWPFDTDTTEESPPIKEEVKIQVEEEVVFSPTSSSPEMSCSFDNLGVYALADWLNHSMIELGLSRTKKYIINNDRCFTYFNTSHHINFWINPFLWHSHYRGGVNDFKITTVGLETGGEYTFYDHVVLGGGIGYLHSNLNKGGGIEGIYFGPYLGYLFPQGSINFTLFWTRNFYHGRLEVCDEKKSKINHHSWDRVFRLEGNYDFQLPEKLGADLYLHPFIQLDYLNVDESSYKLHSEMSIEKRKSAFFDIDLGTRLSKTLVCSKTFLLIPTLTFGWLHTSPIAKHKLVAKNENQSFKVDVSGDHKNQFLFAAELISLYREGLLIGIKYEGHFGSKAPLKAGRIRIEWNW